MTAPKRPQLADVDISTLETIYADGRAMGRLVQDFKNDLASALLEISTLKSELRTERFKLKCVTDLYEKAVVGKKRPTTCRGLPARSRAGQNGTPQKCSPANTLDKPPSSKARTSHRP
jgi:hypothetical protein